MRMYGFKGMTALRKVWLAMMMFVACLFCAVNVKADIASGTNGTCSWVIDDDGTLTIRPTNGVEGTLESYTRGSGPFFDYRYDITKVKINGDVKTGAGCYNLFGVLVQCTEIDLNGLDTSNSTNMESMFSECKTLTSLDLGDKFDTSNVTDMNTMFFNCESITSLDLGDKFNTSNVTDMNTMFSGCNSLTSLDLGDKFDTSKVTNMSYMFSACKALTSLDLGDKFDTSSVTDMTSMFSWCNSLTSLDLGDKFDTSSVTDMYQMFNNCKALTSLDLGDKFDTSKVTSMNSMFSDCQSLTSLDLGDKFDTSKVTNMYRMFLNCRSLTSLDLGDKFDTSLVETMRQMFSGCQALTSLDLGDKFDTSNVIDMYRIFYNCESLTSLDLGDKFDTSKITDLTEMFYACKALTSLDLGDMFDTSRVTGMNSMFYNCYSLASLNLGDKFNTSSVTDMGNMFEDCSSLASLELGDKFDTSNVTDMRGMFYHCKTLKSLNLRDKFDTSNVTNMGAMFAVCESLTSLNLEDKFDTSNVTKMGNMFSGDNKLSSIIFSPTFSFKGNGSTSCELPTPPASTTTGKWIRADGTSGAYEPTDLRDNFDSLPAGVKAGEWVWEERPTKYTITFVVNPSGASGSMPQVKPQAAESFTIPANQFVMRRHVFDHWEDGQGHTYQNNGTIPADTYTAGDNITLTAVLTDASSPIGFTNGEAEFDLYANEKLTFDNIPSGTAYQVYEETPEGWVLIEQSNTSGIIQPLETADARFNNKYQPGTATIQFSGSKTLDNNAASEDAFTFILKEDNVEIDRKSTMNGGFIQFDVIEYTDADVGTHNYTIEEVNPDNDKLIWDTHKESITVVVSKTGSQLSAEATYDSDGIVFKNYTKPGILKIKKKTEGTTEANANDEFTFSVTLNNDKGMPIDNDVQWYKEAS